LATANSGVLVTSGTGVPSIATDIPTAITIGAAYIYRAGGTDVSPADGGSGASTLTGILLGNGTSAFTGLTTSAGIAGAISDETGSGALVFGTSPGFTTAANPVSNDGAALGTTALGWSDLYLANGSVINFNNGNVTLTHSAGLLTLSGDLAVTGGDIGIPTDLDVLQLALNSVKINGSLGVGVTPSYRMDLSYASNGSMLRMDRTTSSTYGRVIFVRGGLSISTATLYAKVSLGDRGGNYDFGSITVTYSSRDSAAGGSISGILLYSVRTIAGVTAISTGTSIGTASIGVPPTLTFSTVVTDASTPNPDLIELKVETSAGTDVFSCVVVVDYPGCSIVSVTDS